MRYDVYNLRVKNGFSPGQRNVVYIAPLFEETNFFLYNIQGLVSFQTLAIATAAFKIANIGNFDPALRVIIERPGEAVKVAFVERGNGTFHEAHPLTDRLF
jgi:hypothetical protein